MKSCAEIKKCLAGPVPSIRTPFTQAGDIDYAALRNMVEFDIAAGSEALIITLGDSLFALLNEQEVAEVTKTVVEQARGRAVVSACTGYWNTSKCVEFAKYVKELGGDILMMFGANWYPECLPVDTLVEHHLAVAQHIPVMANTGYIKIPGIGVGLEVVTRLVAEGKNIIAAKCDVSGEFDRKAVLIAKKQWTLFSGGTKQFHMELHPYGCQGHMTTFMTFKPDVAHNYWNAIQKNDIPGAVKIIEKIDYPFFEFLVSMRGGFDAVMHGVGEVFGLSKRWRRKPFYSLNDEEMEKTRQFFRKLHMI
ncbi:MAG: dihydrodipicolinate synthase family protein [Kiritimatiellae bacterium]|nr:dihydrodipicolinate synthase family protein [Kiritimatiellia bacterium]